MYKNKHAKILLTGMLLVLQTNCSSSRPPQDNALGKSSWKWVAHGLTAWATLSSPSMGTDEIMDLTPNIDGTWSDLDMMITSTGKIATAASFTDENGTLNAIALQHSPSNGDVDFMHYLNANNTFSEGEALKNIQFYTTTEQEGALFFGGTTKSATGTDTAVLHKVSPSDSDNPTTRTFIFGGTSTRLCQIVADQADPMLIWGSFVVGILNSTTDPTYTWLFPFYTANLSVASLGSGSSWSSDSVSPSCSNSRLLAPATGGARHVFFTPFNSTAPYNLLYDKTYSEQLVNQVGDARWYNYTKTIRQAFPKKIDSSVSTFSWTQALPLDDDQDSIVLVGRTNTKALAFAYVYGNASNIVQYWSNDTGFYVYGAQIDGSSAYVSGSKDETGFTLKIDTDTEAAKSYYYIKSLDMQAVSDAGSSKPYLLGTTSKKIRQFKLNKDSACLDLLSKKNTPSFVSEDYVYVPSITTTTGTVYYNLSFENSTLPWKGSMTTPSVKKEEDICDCIGDTIMGWCIEEDLPGWSHEGFYSASAGALLLTIAGLCYCKKCCKKKCCTKKAKVDYDPNFDLKV